MERRFLKVNKPPINLRHLDMINQILIRIAFYLFIYLFIY